MKDISHISFAVVGFGHIGRRHARIIQGYQGCELLAIVDSNPVLSNDSDYPQGVPFFTSLDELFQSGMRPMVINIATPNGSHCALGLHALKKSCHIVIEKPMGLNKQECEELIHVAQEVNRNIFVVKQNRYSPPSKWLKELVVNGIIGEILMVQINCYWNRDERYYSPKSWKGTLALDGGTLFTQFSHFIDIMYWVFGDIQHIQTKIKNFTHDGLTEFEDSGVAHFEFINGGLGSINFSTSVWDANMESSITVLGTKGTLKIGGQYMNTIEYCHIENYTLPELASVNPPNDYGPFKGSAANHHYVIENVVNTLYGTDTITANALEGMKVVDIIERIYAAAD